MKTRALVCAGIALALLVTAMLRAAPQPAPAKASEKLLKAKIDAARKTYEVVLKNHKEALIPFAELAYRWSRRWLEAELELLDRKPERTVAYTAHRDRMRELARVTRDRYRDRVTTIDEVTSTDYYNAEAMI